MNRVFLDGSEPRLPTVGIIGGGQLALMLARAASRIGLRVRVLDPSPTCPARREVAEFCEGSYADPATLQAFAAGADVITLENEFVDARLLEGLESLGHEVRPGSATMARVQDKLVQKETLTQAGVTVVDFRRVANAAEQTAAGDSLGYPLVLKKRCLGYDGTGNFTVQSHQDWDAALAKLGGFAAGLYAERWCPFERELAVIVTRGKGGEVAAYPVVETLQADHVCELAVAPADVDPGVAACASALAVQAVEAVEGVGSFGVELFLLRDGRLLVNEMAPRVHNSGHYTIEACDCSQFENHIRAIRGLPLGSARLRAPAAMVNLLARSEASGAPRGIGEALAVPGAQIHLYGKLRAAPGRKMGHVTALGEDTGEALAIARQAADCIHFDQPLAS